MLRAFAQRTISAATIAHIASTTSRTDSAIMIVNHTHGNGAGNGAALARRMGGRRMAYKPMLFNTEMVKAILDGRKTQTRRIAFTNRELREFRTEEYPDGWWLNGRVFSTFDKILSYPQRPKCRFEPGDILWVRETWVFDSGDDDYGTGCFMYKADMPIHIDAKDTAHGDDVDITAEDYKWRPSIHMPKEAARIFLRVNDVRIERLKDITVEDCMWEGLRKCDWNFCPEKVFKHTECEKCTALQAYKKRFAELWNSTLKGVDWTKYDWDANPWVWVIEFERCERPEGWCV